uniref:Putative secreted protein n=1 Tax=Anopheles darlingi TaxID=43151 RepID=A0A2M4D9S7_ANODA
MSLFNGSLDLLHRWWTLVLLSPILRVLLAYRKAQLFTLDVRSQDVQNAQLAIRQQNVTSIIQLQYYVVRCLAGSELKVDDTIDTELLQRLQPLILQVFPKLHRKPGRSHILRPLEAGRVKA